MKGKSNFTADEISKISQLIEQKLKAPSREQKSIRDKIRALGFYGGEDFGLNNYTVEDFLRVINKSKNPDVLLPWIARYKDLISGKMSSLGYDELYKWNTIQQFQDNWDDALLETNVSELLNRSFNSESNNLWSGNMYYPYAMITELASYDLSKVSAMFKMLFDENQPLEERIDSFRTSAETLRKQHRPDAKNHYQDDRAIMVYLTLRFPAKYYFYKSKMFRQFCEITGFWDFKRITKEDRYGKLVSYLEMCTKVREQLVKDKELLTIHKDRIPPNISFNDEEHLLTQDFIYSVTSYLTKKSLKHSLEEFKEMFREYLERNVPASAKNYLSAIPTVNRIALDNDLLKESVYELQSVKEFDPTVKELNEIEAYQERNRVGHNMFSAALGQYTDFLQELEQDTTIPDNQIQTMALNQILFGPPGTGKTYSTIELAVEVAAKAKSANHRSTKERFDELRRQGQIEFVTFHQNYTYEDFVVGLKPDIDSKELRFVPYKGIFYQMCKRARENYESSKSQIKLEPYEELVQEMLASITDEKPLEFKTIRGKPFWLTDYSDRTIYLRKSTGSEIHTLSIPTLIDQAEGKRELVSGLQVYYSPVIEYLKKQRNPTTSAEPLKNYVLIIDEINRANISKVFGELITLLEDDKRLDGDNELRVTLPNGEKDFAVPPNLYVIGTMNTADKSIALIDIALRRRFEFLGKYPDYDVLRGKSSEAAELLELINAAIYRNKKSADFLIGHAYFLKLGSIEEILRKRVIPLLMEYFAGKTDIVSEVFKDTRWDVQYDIRSFDWTIVRKNS